MENIRYFNENRPTFIMKFVTSACFMDKNFNLFDYSSMFYVYA